MPIQITAWKDSQGRLHERKDDAKRADADHVYEAEYAKWYVCDLTPTDLLRAFLLRCVADDLDIDKTIDQVRTEEDL